MDIAGWLVAAGLAGFALIWTDNFYVNTALIIALLSSGNNGSILSAVSADLFPTHFKYVKKLWRYFGVRTLPNFRCFSHTEAWRFAL